MARVPIQRLSAWPAVAEAWEDNLADMHVNIWDTDSEDGRFDEESYGDDDEDMSYEDDEALDHEDEEEW